MGYGYGMGAGGWIAVTVFWVGLLALVIWGVSRVSGGRPGGDDDTRRALTPEELLDRRYVNGEIDEESYRTMRDTLASARSRRT